MLKFKTLAVAALLMLVATNYSSARIIFLPDAGDNFGISGNQDIGSNHNQGNNCKEYPLSTCPTKGICSFCDFGKYYRLNKCQTGYRVDGNSCVPHSCEVVNSSYIAEIPNNQFCERINVYGLSCYKKCRGISCGGYSLNCDTIASNQASMNIETYQKCPECESYSSSSSVGKCSPNLCKILTCKNNKKVNADGSACINKDSTCPTSHPSKDCGNNGVQKTSQAEDGTPCFLCNAPATCTDYVQRNLTGYNVITSTETLQHALIDNKNNLVVTKNFILTANVDLSGKTFVGANEVASSEPLCANTPSITVESTIATDNRTTIKNLKLINDLNFQRKVGRQHGVEDDIRVGEKVEMPMMIGGGNLSNIEFATVNKGPYSGTYEKPHFVITTIANLDNIKANGGYPFIIEDGGTVNIKGIVDIYENNKAFGFGGAGNTLNIESSGTLTVDKGVVVEGSGRSIASEYSFNDHRQNDIRSNININGKLQIKENLSNSNSDTFYFINGIVNINAPTDLGLIYVSSDRGDNAQININAATTINARGYSPAINLDNGTLNINAPLKIINAKVANLTSQYVGDSMFEVKYMNINSDLIFDNRANFVYVVYIESVKMSSKANIRGLGRVFISYAAYDSNKTIFDVSSGARMEIGGTCRRATSNRQKEVYKSTIDWKAPPSDLFNGGC